MRKTLLSIATLICGIFAMMLVAGPANAQATRTWVSGVGDDANPCSRTAPCKTFAGAISKTAPAGEINVLDPGGFGAVTITKAITISSESFEAGVLVSGTDGIVISAGATDTVILKGLDIEGLGTGLDGIKILAGQTVYVLNCRINHFTGNGINLNSSTANARLIVQNSVITKNTGGLNVQGSGVPNGAFASDTMFDANTNFGVQTNGGNAIGLLRTVIRGSATGISNVGGTGAIISFGPSNLINGTGDVTSTTAYR
jgi:hypothetical protein